MLGMLERLQSSTGHQLDFKAFDGHFKDKIIQLYELAFLGLTNKSIKDVILCIEEWILKMMN